MSMPDEETIRSWRVALEKKLREQKEDDILVSYHDVSTAFPGRRLPGYFDLQDIDSTTLKSWAENLGWNVQRARTNSPNTT